MKTKKITLQSVIKRFPKKQFNTLLDLEKLETLLSDYVLECIERMQNYDNKTELIDKAVYKEKKRIISFLKKFPYSEKIPFEHTPYPSKKIQIILDDNTKDSLTLDSINNPYLTNKILKILKQYSEDLFRELPEFDKKSKKATTLIFETYVISLYSLLFLKGLNKHLEPIQNMNVGFIRDVFDTFGIDFKVTYYRKIIKNARSLYF